jgi:hypothetical protein
MGLFPRLYLTFLTGCVIALGVCLYEVNRREKSDAASNAAAATAAHAPQRWFEDSDVRIRALEDDLRVRRAESAPAFGFADTRWKSLVSCAISGARSRTVVILIAGQSNAGNHGGGDPYVARDQVDNFNLKDGLCYHAADPLLGTTAEGANFATRLGDLLIDAGAFDRVILVPIAVGGTTMEEWAGDSPVARLLCCGCCWLVCGQITSCGNTGRRLVSRSMIRWQSIAMSQTCVTSSKFSAAAAWKPRSSPP